jgi:hypothetical protein
MVATPADAIQHRLGNPHTRQRIAGGGGIKSHAAIIANEALGKQ